MTTPPLEQLFQSAQQIMLREEVKRRGRARLATLIHTQPSPLRVVRASTGDSGVRIFASLFLRPALSVVFLVMLLLTSTVGVAWAAEGTVPGERLYPIKTRVTEPLRSVLALTPARKAEWETERINRRVQELNELEATERLDEVKRGSLESGLQQHVERLESLGEDEGEDQATEYQEHIREQLRGHELIEWQESDQRIRVRIRERRANAAPGGERQLEPRATETREAESDEDRDEFPTEQLRESTEDRADAENSVEETTSHGKREERTATSEKIIVPSKPKTESTSTTGNSGSGDAQESDTADRDESDDEESDDEEDETAPLISESTARTKALQAVAGTVQEAKLEKKTNESVWKVEIERASDGETVKVTVNAYSGSIIDVDD